MLGRFARRPLRRPEGAAEALGQPVGGAEQPRRPLRLAVGGGDGGQPDEAVGDTAPVAVLVPDDEAAAEARDRLGVVATDASEVAERAEGEAGAPIVGMGAVLGEPGFEQLAGAVGVAPLGGGDAEADQGEGGQTAAEASVEGERLLVEGDRAVEVLVGDHDLAEAVEGVGDGARIAGGAGDGEALLVEGGRPRIIAAGAGQQTRPEQRLGAGGGRRGVAVA